ncbi:MAG: hypothetical protein AB7N65_18600 [Vicinamibacterales bacterium]
MRVMPLAASDVQRIAEVGEPILRNLNITAAYSALSRGMADWLPGAANWCTFATWASRQAGCSIRKEDIARLVTRRLETRLAARPVLRRLDETFDLPVDRIAVAIGDLSQALPGVDRASDAVARGNLKVFEEIGFEFARFLEAAGSPDPDAAIGAFSASLNSGPPPDGQDLLKRAFSQYVMARRRPAGPARAQQILLANILIGLHEQTRLQPEILEAMDAAMLDVADTRRRVLSRIQEVLTAPLLFGRTDLGRGLLNRIADDIAVELRSIVRAITTDRLMTIGLPDDRALHLGRDVVGSYPPSLTTLANAELLTLLTEYDETPDSTHGSGALDWSVLGQRLHFIADLFRAYQEDETLLNPPFSPAQLDAIAAGRVPEAL